MGSKEQGFETTEKVYQFIVKYMCDVGYAPSIREIGDAVGLMSTSSVYRHLTRLEIKGCIKTKEYSPRAIQLIGYRLQKVEG